MVYETLGSHATDWAGKTHPEITDIAAADGSVLVVPVGSIEQHGHHLPVATDTILVDAVAHLGADRVTGELPVLVTPPIWAGYSPHHLSFGGTITLDHDDLLATIEGVTRAALDNGFDAILLVNGHGGNGPLIGSATSTIGVEHPDVEVAGVTYFMLATPFIDELRESDTGGMAHGGEFETSLMLHVRPDLVDEERMCATTMENQYTHGPCDLFDDGLLSVYRPFWDYSETGAIGDPELATAEKGEQIYKQLGDELESLLRELHTHVK